MRVMGHNVLAIVLAAVAFWILGWAWYGVVFMDAWMAGMGYTESGAPEPLWMAVGALTSLLTVVGLSIVLRWHDGMPDLVAAVRKATLVWVGFGLTAALYGLAYSEAHSAPVFLIDAGYSFVGWNVAAAILAAMK